MRCALILAVCWSLLGCSGAVQRQEDEESAGPIVTERWVRVESARGSPSLRFAGRWIHDASGHAELASPTRATVLAVHVQPGSEVQQGQLLLSLALPDAVEARGARAAAQLRSRAYTERLAHLQELQREGLVRGGDVADVRMRLAEAQASQAEADSQLRAITQSGVVMRGDHAELHAPIAGIVTSIRAQLGQTVDQSSGALVSIVAAHGRRIEARLPFRIGPDTPVEWTQEDGTRHSLVFVGLAPEVSADDGMQLAWFDAQGTPGIAGATASLRAVVDDAWLVPDDALETTSDSVRVRTRAHGVQTVQRLFSVGTFSVVRGQLAEDDFVALRARTP